MNRIYTISENREEHRTADPEIYDLAKRFLDECGSGTAEYAHRKMRRYLAEDDPRLAGVWLAIGNAVEELQTLPPDDRRH